MARDKKAQRVVVLDMRRVCTFTDFFVILSGTSSRQVVSFAKAIEDDLAKDGIKPFAPVSSCPDTGWVALDFSSVVVHVFLDKLREFYALEHLWSDAKRLRIPSSKQAKSKRARL